VSSQVGVACIVIRDDETRPVLLLRRAFGRFDGEWCFVAGTARPDEPPREAAKRELEEETGLRAPDLIELSLYEEPGCEEPGNEEPGLELHVFVARLVGVGNVRLDSEHSEYEWVTFEQALDRLPLEAQRSALLEARAT